jgi:hypothetical protein
MHLPPAEVDPLCQASLSSPSNVALAAGAAATVVNFGGLSALIASAASAPAAAPWIFAAQVLLFKTCHLMRRSQDLADAYWGERRGRARVEREMRRIADVQLTTSDGFFVQPVGVVRSCYKQCIGTPRQGLLAPSSRASIVFVKSISPGITYLTFILLILECAITLLSFTCAGIVTSLADRQPPWTTSMASATCGSHLSST